MQREKWLEIGKRRKKKRKKEKKEKEKKKKRKKREKEKKKKKSKLYCKHEAKKITSAMIIHGAASSLNVSKKSTVYF